MRTDTEVGTTGAEEPCAGFLGGQTKHRSEDQWVWHRDEDHIQDDHDNGHWEAVPDVNGDVSTGQAGASICSQ